MFTVVFVCTGNTCRSPMAEAIACRVWASDPEVKVGSAGLAATAGSPASNHAVFVTKDRGGDLANHRSRPASEQILREADLVVTMTRGHRDELRARHPDLASQILTLAEMSGLETNPDVPDPYGGPLEVYESTYDAIAEHIAASTSALRARVVSKSSARQNGADRGASAIP